MAPTCSTRTEAPRQRDILLVARDSEVQLTVAAELMLAAQRITARPVWNNERPTALFVSGGRAQRVEK